MRDWHWGWGARRFGAPPGALCARRDRPREVRDDPARSTVGNAPVYTTRTMWAGRRTCRIPLIAHRHAIDSALA